MVSYLAPKPESRVKDVSDLADGFFWGGGASNVTGLAAGAWRFGELCVTALLQPLSF